MFNVDDFEGMNRDKARHIVERFIENHKHEVATHNRSRIEKCFDLYAMHVYEVNEYIGISEWDDFIRKELSCMSYKNARHYFKVGEFLWHAYESKLRIDKGESISPIRSLVYATSDPKEQIIIWLDALELSQGRHPTEKQIKTACEAFFKAKTAREVKQAKKEAASQEKSNVVSPQGSHQSKPLSRSKRDQGNQQKSDKKVINIEIRKQQRKLIRELRSGFLHESGDNQKILKTLIMILRYIRRSNAALPHLGKIVSTLKQYESAGGQFNSTEVMELEKELKAQVRTLEAAEQAATH
jgi:hypothetical protein